MDRIGSDRQTLRCGSDSTRRPGLTIPTPVTNTFLNIQVWHIESGISKIGGKHSSTHLSLRRIPRILCASHLDRMILTSRSEKLRQLRNRPLGIAQSCFLLYGLRDQNRVTDLEGRGHGRGGGKWKPRWSDFRIGLSQISSSTRFSLGPRVRKSLRSGGDASVTTATSIFLGRQLQLQVNKLAQQRLTSSSK
jgi:hypothetical protein